MSDRDLENLFTPGDGGVPPYLAGRKREQDFFQKRVKALIARKPISQNMIVYGPRGNGKTALLRYLQKETLQKEGDKVDILRVTPSRMRTPDELADCLIGDNQKLRDRIISAGFSGGIGFLGVKAELDWSRPVLTIERLLQERSQDTPLILIVDEAHRLQPQVAETLLNASQSVRIEGYPFLLVLAGTPNLEAALARAGASFWDRSKIFALGRLSPEEAVQAITKPLQGVGISFASGVAEEVVDRAHCYPFFLQIWGDCLARSLAQTDGAEITLERVREVEAEVMNERDAMYQRRYNEIKRMKLLPAAQRVAEAFIQTDKPHLHESVLEQAIGAGMSGEEEFITENLDQLMQLGYVWRVGGEGLDYEPGILSLMTFVQEYARQAETTRARSMKDQVSRWRATQSTDQDNGIGD